VGMFDEVIIQPGHKCPSCKKELQLSGWQTKDISGTLFVWTEGLDMLEAIETTVDVMKPNPEQLDKNVKDVYIYSDCKHCNEWIEFRAEIVNYKILITDSYI